MHAKTIEEHERLTHGVRAGIAYAWQGTDPMCSTESVRGALEAAGTPPEEVEPLLPYVVDACRSRGLLVAADTREGS